MIGQRVSSATSATVLELRFCGTSGFCSVSSPTLYAVRYVWKHAWFRLPTDDVQYIHGRSTLLMRLVALSQLTYGVYMQLT